MELEFHVNSSTSGGGVFTYKCLSLALLKSQSVITMRLQGCIVTARNFSCVRLTHCSNVKK